MAMIGLIYLVWGPLGPKPLREFLRSYQDHATGVEHELVIMFNGVAHEEPRDKFNGPSGESSRLSASTQRAALLAELGGTEHCLVELEHPVLDLPAYGLAARQLEHDRLCFLNSYSTILADGWLGQLARALDEPGVGMAGATGSWESQAEWVRGKPVYWPYQLALLRRARRDYPRFPNPHLRTTAFAIDRLLLLEIGLERAVDKHATYLLESGWSSLTRHIVERDLRPVVVGRDGRIFDVEDWPRSATYRAGGQENLLVADNRTRDWGRASARLRRRLSRDAWGEKACV
jgi:hypothetical protein